MRLYYCIFSSVSSAFLSRNAPVSLSSFHSSRLNSTCLSLSRRSRECPSPPAPVAKPVRFCGALVRPTHRFRWWRPTRARVSRLLSCPHGCLFLSSSRVRLHAGALDIQPPGALRSDSNLEEVFEDIALPCAFLEIEMQREYLCDVFNMLRRISL